MIDLKTYVGEPKDLVKDLTEFKAEVQSLWRMQSLDFFIKRVIDWYILIKSQSVEKYNKN